MREWVNAANCITSANLAAGFVAVLLAIDGQLVAAGALVAVAAGLDSIDGVIARRLNVAGRFGGNLDSLADMVSFGVAPAIMLHSGSFAGLPVLGGAACLGFVLAGAWRLARYPLVAHNPHWVGLPIPAAGVITGTAAALVLPPIPLLGLTLTVALLMISTLPFPTLRMLTGLTRHRANRPTTRRDARRASQSSAVAPPPSRRSDVGTRFQAERSKADDRRLSAVSYRAFAARRRRS